VATANSLTQRFLPFSKLTGGVSSERSRDSPRMTENPCGSLRAVLVEVTGGAKADEPPTLHRVAERVISNTESSRVLSVTGGFLPGGYQGPGSFYPVALLPSPWRFYGVPKREKREPGTVAHTSNLSYSGG
jgi:hypothetical protein